MTSFFQLARSASCLFTFLHPTHFSFTNLLIGILLAIAAIELLAVAALWVVFGRPERERTDGAGKGLFDSEFQIPDSRFQTSDYGPQNPLRGGE